jgi:heptosyltransferase-1
MDRILIARFSAMGDIIHSLPAVAAIRHAFPSAHIGWIVEQRWQELLAARSAVESDSRSEARPLVDRIHTIDTRSWRSAVFSPRTWREIRNIIGDLRRQRYQIVIDLQAALRSALLGRMSGAGIRMGFAKPRETIALLFYNNIVHANAEHVVDQGMEIARTVTDRGDAPVEFPLPRDSESEAWCDAELARLGVASFAIMSPGAGWGAKCWPPKRYGEVAKLLGQEGIPTLINFSSGEEALARAVEAESRGAARPLSCSVGQLVALSRRARLVIGGDTGPVHLAAALGVSVVAIYGPTNPQRNGPYAPHGSTERIAVLRCAESQTSHARRPRPDPGLLQITAQQVFDASRSLLRGAP